MEPLNTFAHWHSHFLFFMIMSGGIFYFLTVIATLLVYSIKKAFIWMAMIPTTILGSIFFAYLLNNSQNDFSEIDMLILTIISAIHAGVTVLLVAAVLFWGNRSKKKGRKP